MEHHWLVTNEKIGRTFCAAKQWTRPIHRKRAKSIGAVGFLVNKNIKDRVVEFRGDSSRVASLTIKINTKYYLQVVQSMRLHQPMEMRKWRSSTKKLVRS